MAVPSKWEQLQNLKDVYDLGFMSKDEYAFRKRQIIDDLTGTTKSSERKISRPQRDFTLPTIIPHAPPDFSLLPSEKAIKYVFNHESMQWTTSKCTVRIDETPFSKGSLRMVYYLKVSDESVCKVAKLSMDPKDQVNRKLYFNDVLVQTYAQQYAEWFNSYNPPKTVAFVKAALIELQERPGTPLCAIEHYIEGPYRKHNNNFGYVSEEERNTPQAFSHFSYIASGGKLLICDIQGVSDLYTDPQIHTIDRRRLAQGDLGRPGIERFLETHRCNPICRYLKIPPINPNEADLGTLPSQSEMTPPRINVIDLDYSLNSNLESLLKKEEECCQHCCII